jgi:hypothetical protein
MTNATIYFDDSSDPRNPGWVCETDDDGRPQFQMNTTDPSADDKTLLVDARSFANGEITIRRKG